MDTHEASNKRAIYASLAGNERLITIARTKETNHDSNN